LLIVRARRTNAVRLLSVVDGSGSAIPAPAWLNSGTEACTEESAAGVVVMAAAYVVRDRGTVRRDTPGSPTTPADDR
jgi:hypothetical protein